MKKVVFIAKTDLNKDGRILNQIRILQEKFNNKFELDFLLFPDKKPHISLGDNIRVIELNTIFRNSNIFRILTVIEFCFKALVRLFRIKPDIIHVHDFAVILPVYLYSFVNRSCIFIYDDHELPNKNESLQYKLFQKIEKSFFSNVDLVIFANSERRDYVQKQLGLKVKTSYFLNLPYYNTEISVKCLKEDLQEKLFGKRFIIHQGALEVERGREKLACFSRLLPKELKIAVLGVSQADFDFFIDEYKLVVDNFIFLGSVDYVLLDSIWSQSSGALVMYLPTLINNRLCAPNRYFIGLKYNIPIIVNRDNPVLFNLTERFKSGVYIEDIKSGDDIEKVLNMKLVESTLDDLIYIERLKFEENYEVFIS